ncbi:T9SS type A sorting domain-containing protein [bacterium]|nr:T9SS type A sorting domain-containing protein [bacterium]
MTIGGPGGFLDQNDGDGTIAENRFDPNYVAVYLYDGDSYYYRGKDIAFPDPVTGEDPENLMFGFNNIQAGQGFFVLAMKDGVMFHFDRDMQTHATSTVILKSEGDNEYWPGIMLKATCGGEESFTTVAFNEQMTAGLDPGYDVGLLTSGKNAEIYTTLVTADNRVNFARQILPVPGEEKLVVPVGVDSRKGGEVAFEAFTVPAGDKKFWLEDRTKGKFIDLSKESYSTILPADTYGTGRFFIIASANMPTGVNGNPVDEGTGLRIWTYDGMIIIKGPVSDGSVCELYNSAGSKILTCRLPDTGLNTVTLPVRLNGVFIVRVIDGEKIVTVKLVIPGT